MGERRQEEILEVADALAHFEPDKVFVERNPEFEYVNRVQETYAAFRRGEWVPGVNEIYQLGFRVANWLGHERIYPADHPGRWGAYYGTTRAWAEANGQLDLLEARGPATCRPFYLDRDEASLRRSTTIMDYLRYLNGPRYQRRDHGFYVSVFPRVGYLERKTSEDAATDPENYFVGAELLADWYRRNIRIYANVLTALDWSEERILLIFGNGHSSTLKHLFASNPYFQVEDPLEHLVRPR